MTHASRICLAILSVCCAAGLVAQQQLTLPLRAGSVRFAVLGDTGTGDTDQREVAEQLVIARRLFPFTFALMLGDNLYGSERPQDYRRKFEVPYQRLLDAKVEFHAALGNHDDPNQRFYKLFNLGGERYRTFRKENVRFFVLDSNYMDPGQVKWLEEQLQASGSDWKIPYFHHPIYTSASRGPVIELRTVLEPLFVKYGVDVVLSGHEHSYERTKPQQGVHYFISGASAKLNRGDLEESSLTEVGFDTDRTFMLMEIAGDELFFQTLTRAGATVDRGVITRREVPGAGPPKMVPSREAAPPG